MQCNGVQQFEKICRAQVQITKAGAEKKGNLQKKISTKCGIFIIQKFPFPDLRSHR
jgi:hypothetical protein